MTDHGPNVLQSALRVLHVLETICEADAPVSLARVAEAVDSTEVTAFRAVETLLSEGYVERAAGGRAGYVPGWRLVELAAPMLARNELRARAQPVLRNLADVYDESVTLAIPMGSRVLFVDRISSNRTIEFYCDIGRSLPLHIGAAARSVLAHYPQDLFDQYLERPLERMTEATTVDREGIRRDRDEIRSRGYAVSKADVEIGISGVGAPIFNPDGHLIGAAAIANVSERWDDEDIAERAASVIAACEEIGRRSLGISYEPRLEGAGS